MTRTLRNTAFILGLVAAVAAPAGAASPPEPKARPRPVLKRIAPAAVPAPQVRPLPVMEVPDEAASTPRQGVNSDAGVPPSSVPAETMHA